MKHKIISLLVKQFINRKYTGLWILWVLVYLQTVGAQKNLTWWRSIRLKCSFYKVVASIGQCVGLSSIFPRLQRLPFLFKRGVGQCSLVIRGCPNHGVDLISGGHKMGVTMTGELVMCWQRCGCCRVGQAIWQTRALYQWTSVSFGLLQLSFFCFVLCCPTGPYYR